MKKSAVEVGNHHDGSAEIQYVLSLVKYRGPEYVDGDVVKEFPLEKGHQTTVTLNVR